MKYAYWIALAITGTGCGATTPGGESIKQGAAQSPELVTLTIVGTNDMHGSTARLPLLAGYFDVIREQTNGRLLLLDGGDMFQGTLESNLGEGDVMIEAMNAMGYTAATVGNHEFDFGPVGDNVISKEDGEDPRGALKARAKQAKFPILTGNIVDKKSRKPVEWPNMPATLLVERDGIKIGIIGLSTVDTPTTTIPANVSDLAFSPLADATSNYGAFLRNQGATVIVVVAHAGAKCKEFANPNDLSSCEPGHEIFELAERLAPGTVDVIVGGHTHSGVAHMVNGVAVIESFAHAKAFGRVDLAVDRKTGKVVSKRIYPPHRLCEKEPCSYEGRTVHHNPTIAKIDERANKRARVLAGLALKMTLKTPFPRKRTEESAAGNWLADQMLKARPKADASLTNGGGLRADLPAGELTYGALHSLVPFDNRFAMVEVNGAELKHIIESNLGEERGILSLAGIRAEAKCAGGKMVLKVVRDNGKPVGDQEKLQIVTSDFLATGGDGALAKLGRDRITIESGRPIRDEIAGVVTKQGGAVSANQYYDPKAKRLRYPGTRPVRCKK